MSEASMPVAIQLPIETFRRLPATVVVALAADYPDGVVVVTTRTIASLIHGHKARPGDVAAILCDNAPRGVRRLWELARSEVLDTPMPTVLAAAIRSLDDAVRDFLGRVYDPQIGMDAVERAFLRATDIARRVYDDGATREGALWYWTAMAFTEVAIARATLHATSAASHRELALLVDHYCDCLGDYRQFFEEFPYDDGPNAHTVAVVAGFAELGGAA